MIPAAGARRAAVDAARRPSPPIITSSVSSTDKDKALHGSDEDEASTGLSCTRSSEARTSRLAPCPDPAKQHDPIEQSRQERQNFESEGLRQQCREHRCGRRQQNRSQRSTPRRSCISRSVKRRFRHLRISLRIPRMSPSWCAQSGGWMRCGQDRQGHLPMQTDPMWIRAVSGSSHRGGHALPRPAARRPGVHERRRATPALGQDLLLVDGHRSGDRADHGPIPPHPLHCALVAVLSFYLKYSSGRHVLALKSLARRRLRRARRLGESRDRHLRRPARWPGGGSVRGVLASCRTWASSPSCSVSSACAARWPDMLRYTKRPSRPNFWVSVHLVEIPGQLHRISWTAFSRPWTA